ncbi:hypothetical protein FGG08_007408 [Glutinoglossum americanum]|uniref:beta-glucosidase n=1 Tax=Glutinoglossum americanum TaxID=1670608 RepID=A0A9P8L033_9PEZI|nr:hypothetical protein FGG08_007408 [Glutinoglossum americanum]
MKISPPVLCAVSLFLGSASAIPADPNDQPQKRASAYFSPPYYPTPKGGWVPEWRASYAKAQALVSQMTLAERVNLTTGTGLFMGRCVGNTGSVPRFGIPSLCLEDSPLGVAHADNITAFPAGITVGATWDKDLMYIRGVALGAEARGKGVNVQLGPSIGPIGRNPWAGRNWESFGADPYLQGIGGYQTVKGMQSNGVIATAKHLIGNEQEQHRLDSRLQPAISSDIDDRTLHELYLWPFAEAVRAGVGSVMIAYNELNDSSCSQNSKLINGILKDELGFQGFVMTDWLAQGDGAIPFIGNSYWAYDLSISILNGSVPLDRLNDMATRIVATWYQFGQDANYPPPNFSSNTRDRTGPLYPAALSLQSGVVNEYVNVQADHYKIVREIGRDAITMLKNDNNALPLSKNAKIRVFGSDAGSNPKGPNSCENRACNIGVLGMGWGSGSVDYPYLIAPIDAIKAIASDVIASLSDTFPRSQTATNDEIALVFLSADSGENQNTVEDNPGDRLSLATWHNGDALVQAAAKTYKNVVVIIHTVGPVTMDAWINLPSVKSVLIAHLPGQEAGNSLTDILFGAYSPSGHLPYTIPKSEAEISVFKPVGAGFNIGQIESPFSEGLYIDYRYYEKMGIEPRFPFGHGLSYTTFAFGNATIKRTAPLTEVPPPPPPKGPTPTYPTNIPPPSEVAWPTKGFNRVWRLIYPYVDNPQNIRVGRYPYPDGYSTVEKPLPLSGGAQGGNPSLWAELFQVSVQITNTGSVPGKVVAQLYLQFPPSIPYDTPRIQLRGFTKTLLSPGQTTTVTLSLTRKDLSVWDVVRQNWVIPGIGGAQGYTVWVGESSKDLRVKCDTVSLVC